MQFDHVSVSMMLQLPQVQSVGPISMTARDVGERLAEAVDARARSDRLGYYPALEYFENTGKLDDELIETARNMSWNNSKLARETIEKRLKPIFSSVKFQSIQTVAFNMPTIRPNNRDAFVNLVRHYTPDVIRVDLLVSMIRRENDRRRDGAEGYARKMMFRWLSESFENIEITSSKQVES